MSDRPNLILIMCDQMRYDCAGFAGSRLVQTPNLDELAHSGVVCEQTYCASPVCSPARASWLTGLYPHATGQLVNAGPAVAAAAESPGFESAPAPDHSIGNCVRYALSGVVASSAMLLPGISGSFLLLLLGIYQEIVVFLNPLSSGFDLLLTAIFLAGCVIGLVLFARLINFLLERCHSPTMAFLGGLMMGSLWTLWPFRSAESYRPGWPGEEDSAMGMSLIAFLAGAAIIAAFARYGRDPKSTGDRTRGKAEA